MPPVREATAGVGNNKNPLPMVRRAKGGCGLIIPEFTSVDPDSGHCNRIQLGIWDERQIASSERICDAVPRHGAKIFVQLHHGGREAPPAINGGRQAMAPSVELNSVVGRATILPREMTIEDIDRLVGLFIQACLLYTSPSPRD